MVKFFKNMVKFFKKQIASVDVFLQMINYANNNNDP
jgi:hypothetical protein